MPTSNPPDDRTNNLSAIRTISEPGRWDEYSRERDQTADIVQAVEFTLDQSAAGGGVDLIVICDLLTIDGQIVLPSKNVSLFARKIFCENNAVIDTSGKDAVADPKRASDGLTPGSSGAKGATGPDGAQAGAIFIAAGEVNGSLQLSANGGAAAKGQQGGQGAVGKVGAVGSNATERDRPGNGGPGGKGGKGGMGGDGGTGGSSGQITVLTLEEAAAITLNATGGKGGNVGDPGSGGKGGAGGAPGDNHFYTPPRHGPDGGEPGGESWWDPGANPGPHGADGDFGDVNPAVSTSGTSVRPVAKTVDISEIASQIPITQLGMTLSRAYLSFANRDDTDLADRLDWVRKVALAPESGARFYDARAARAGSVQVGRPSGDEVNAVRSQAAILLDRLRLGLDVFGYQQNYVSSLNQEYLEGATAKRVEIAKSIEEAHDKYFDNITNLQEAGARLRVSLTLVQKSREQFANDKAQFDAQANQTQDEIALLGLTMSDLQQKIQAADYTLKDAVAGKAGGGCDLLKMIEFVAGVIMICYGCYEGAMAIGDAMRTANSASESGGIIKDLEFVVETFDKFKVADYFKKMQEGFNKVEDALKTDSAKLVVSLEAFEKELQPYMDLEAAQQYRDLLRQFIDVAKARNDKLLAYSQLVLKSAETEVQDKAIGLEADRIAGLVAQTNNPALVDCVVFLTKYLAAAKRGLLELLELQRRALVYTSLVPSRPAYKWTVVAELDNARAALGQLVIAAAERRGRNPQRLDAEFSISRKANPTFFDQLKRNGSAAFAIPINHPQFNRGGTAFVTVYQVGLSAAGIQSKTNEFTLRLTHQGNSTVKDQAGNLMNFSHRTRPTILSYKIAPNGLTEIVAVENNLGGDDNKYLYLSPFAGWTLQTEGDDHVDWSKVAELKFLFKATFIPADRAAAIVDFSFVEEGLAALA
jgi:hypothetical protein